MNTIELFGRLAALTGGFIVTVFIALYGLVRAEKALNRGEQQTPIQMKAREELSAVNGGDPGVDHV